MIEINNTEDLQDTHPLTYIFIWKSYKIDNLFKNLTPINISKSLDLESALYYKASSITFKFSHQKNPQRMYTPLPWL